MTFGRRANVYTLLKTLHRLHVAEAYFYTVQWLVIFMRRHDLANGLHVAFNGRPVLRLCSYVVRLLCSSERQLVSVFTKIKVHFIYDYT